MKNNIILTGHPGVGKSTLLQKIIEEIQKKSLGKEIFHGFLTKEILGEGGKRIGFSMDGGIIAHVNSKSETRVSKYGVNISVVDNVSYFNDVALPKFNENRILFIDEIGEIQLYSNVFKKMTKKILDRKQICLATMSAVFHNRFTDSIRKRSDISLIDVNIGNRDQLLERLPYFIYQAWVNNR